VEQVMRDLGNDEEERRFKDMLLTSLSEREGVSIVFKYRYSDDYLLEYLLASQKAYRASDTSGFFDMENVLDAEFLPLAIYLNLLEREKLTEEQQKFVSLYATAKVGTLLTKQLTNQAQQLEAKTPAPSITTAPTTTTPTTTTPTTTTPTTQTPPTQIPTTGAGVTTTEGTVIKANTETH